MRKESVDVMPGERQKRLKHIGGAAICLAVSLLSAYADEIPALCDGRPYPLTQLSNSATPHVTLTVNGRPGTFLIDYGATRSLLWKTGATPGITEQLTISIPGLASAEFLVSDAYPPPRTAEDSMGVIGTDLLSLVTVQLTDQKSYFSPGPCNPDELRKKGLTAIDQKGFFSSDLDSIGNRRPNVPIVFLSIGDVRASAQIDTGYDDRLYPRSVDVNQAFFDRLVKNGVDLVLAGQINVKTCEGLERRLVYSLTGLPLVIEAEDAKAIKMPELFHLVLKPSNNCGGISRMHSPAAQLGSSFLRLFETIVFDPHAGLVWIK
jgi:hypothetical protein